MQIILSNPRGFCAGVHRAIEIVERALELFGAPIYVRHEVVHNRYVVDELREKGAIFVEEIGEIPDDSIVIFSAHGVSLAVREEAKQRSLQVFDATCPLVTKVHMEVSRYSREGHEVILIGHRGHPEVEGTMGQYRQKAGKNAQMYLVESVLDAQTLEVNNPGHVAFVTQTTLSVDDTKEIIDVLNQRFPSIIGPKKDDICYATQNRQDAVKKLVHESDLILVVGSKTSSNSSRLKEIANKQGVESYLIDGPDDINVDWIKDKKNIGITAGASAPEILVQQVIRRLESLGATLSAQEVVGREEHVVFALPKSLHKKVAAQ